MDGMSTPNREERGGYQQAILCELRMLFDYIAASPGSSLADVGIPDEAHPCGKLGVQGMLRRMEEIEAKLRQTGALAPDDAAFLHLARDAMVRKAWPASGLTVAFTALVADPVREPTSESRASLAGLAYPGLRPLAQHQRKVRHVLLGLALVMTLLAGWESAKVALGRSLLDNLGGLRAQQQALDGERNRLEASLDDRTHAPGQGIAMADGVVPLTAFSLCNRPAAIAFNIARADPGAMPPDPGSVAARDQTIRAAIKEGTTVRPSLLPPLEPLKMYGSSQERDVCERDRNLGYSFRIVHGDLERYRSDWAGMVGSVFAVTAATMNATICRLVPCSTMATASRPGEEDVEFMIAPVLMVWGNYALPVIFGLLGSVIFVILDFYNKMRTSTLHPRDTMLSWIRLVLGMVTGACVGLFFSASGPTMAGPGATLAQGLSLSASGIAFLAGFGVEGVFSMLEGLVRQVFPATPEAPKER